MIAKTPVPTFKKSIFHLGDLENNKLHVSRGLGIGALKARKVLNESLSII